MWLRLCVVSALVVASSGVPLGSIVPYGRCLATRVADDWAVTTISCAAGSQDSVELDEHLSLIRVSSGDVANVDAVDFEAASWTEGFVGVLRGKGVSVATATPVNQFGAPVPQNGAIAVTPQWTNCSIIDGAPFFVDMSAMGASSWLEIPVVGVVDASASTCTTLSVRPLSPVVQKIGSLATRDTVWVFVPQSSYLGMDDSGWFLWFLFVLVAFTLSVYCCCPWGCWAESEDLDCPPATSRYARLKL